MNNFRKIKLKLRSLREKSPFGYDLITSLFISYLLVLVMTNYIVYPVHVDGSSMYPTLHDLDYGFSNLLSYRSEGVDHGDLVIIYYAPIKEYLIKRVIGLPGDLIECKNDIVFINGKPIDEPYLNTAYRDQWVATGKPFTADFGPIFVKVDEVFVMGDNRRTGGSTDSRVFGPLKTTLIRSKDVYIFWPLSHFKWLSGN